MERTTGGGLTGKTPTLGESLPSIAMCLNAGAMGRQDWESETLIPTIGGDFDVTHSLRADGFDASEDGTGRGTPLVPVAFSCKDHGADAADTAPTLRAMGHSGSHANAGGQVAVAFQSSQSGVRTDDVHATLDSNNGSRRHNGAIHGSAVRRLTPRECERLQGFPDNFTLVTFRGKPAADGPRYKALGNSMAVPCMAWLGQRIQSVHSIKGSP